MGSLGGADRKRFDKVGAMSRTGIVLPDESAVAHHRRPLHAVRQEAKDRSAQSAEYGCLGQCKRGEFCFHFAAAVNYGPETGASVESLELRCAEPLGLLSLPVF